MTAVATANVSRKIVALRRLLSRLGAAATDPYFWRVAWIRASRGVPFWFTDRNGVSLCLHPEDNLRLILKKKLFFDDEGMLAAARLLVGRGMTVLDVGAHYGQFGILAAQWVGNDGSVHAFEPTPYACKRLRENVDRCHGLAGTIRVNQIAVGNHGGSVMLYEFPPTMSSWNSLSRHVMYGANGPVEPCRTDLVQIVTLDDYCKTHGIHYVDLLKIDVEGFELEVLQGCEGLLRGRRIRNVIFEISLEPAKATGRTAEHVLHAVAAMGFTLARIQPDGGLERIGLSEFVAPYFANYLATPVAP